MPFLPDPFGFTHQANKPARSRRLIQYRGDSHLISFGPTGTGKGRSVVVPNLLNFRGTAVVVDLKNGELAKLTARRRREFGDVYVIDPFEVTNFPNAGFDPFDIFTWPGVQREADAEMLSDIFSQGNKGVKDPFWDQHGSGLLSAIMAYVSTLPAAERSIPKVIDRLMSDDVVYNLAVMLDTLGKKIPRMSYREIASFLQLPDITRGGVLATTHSYLKTFHSEAALRTFERSDIDLCDFINGRPMTIYIVMPVDRIHSHRAIIKLIVGVLLKAIVTRRCRPETRTLMLIDECGQLGTFPFLETFITLCRSFGCWAWTFWQDLAQLQSCYPSAWKTILNNSGVVQAFGFHNRDLAEQWSGYFDSTPDELRRLSRTEQVLMIPGEGEYRGQRLDYLFDPIFAGLFDDNPLYQQGSPLRRIPEPVEEPPVVGSNGTVSRKSTAKSGNGDGGGGMQVR